MVQGTCSTCACSGNRRWLVSRLRDSRSAGGQWLSVVASAVVGVVLAVAVTVMTRFGKPSVAVRTSVVPSRRQMIMMHCLI